MSSIRAFFSPRDMSQGRPWKRIIEFAIPMLIGNIAQQLYNTADSIIVGIYVGDNALAAVGSAAPILNLLLALFIGVSTGAGILVAQSFGAKDRARLSQVVGNSITLTLIVSAAIMALGALFTRPLLSLLNTPISIYAWAADYLTIFFLGIAGFAFYNIFSGILRGMGDSFSALLFLLVAAALNVVLDLWFVAGLGMGVPGVALATIISQFISAILCFIKLKSMDNVVSLRWKLLRPVKSSIGQIVRLGVPSGITQAIFSMAMLVVQSLTNSFGETFIACNVIVMRVDGFAMMPNFTFGETMATFTGQNVGAGRLDRIKKGTLQGTLIAVGTATVITSLLLFVGPMLMGVFTDTQYLIDYSARMMRILAVGYIAIAVTQSLSGVMRGSGNTIIPMWISLITTVVIRVPLAYGIAYFTRSEANPNGMPECIFISLLISWVMGALITSAFYASGIWKKRLKKNMRV